MKINSVKDLEAAYRDDVFHAWNRDAAMMAIRQSPKPAMCLAGAYLMDMKDRDTFGYRYLMQVMKDTGQRWKPQYQKRGTCVGQGGKLGADAIMSVNHLVYGRAWQGRASVAGMYAGSRVDVGNRPGRWDGSTGIWLSDWVSKKGGVLLMKDIGLPDDSQDPDEQMGVRWTNSREGVPAQEERISRERPVQQVVHTTDAREAAKVIQNLGFVINCSNLIPTGRRDRNGFSPVRRSGGHCTLFWAVRYNPFGLLYQNSWDGWGDGPTFPDDQPPGSVWVDEDEANAILRQGDSYGWIGVQGFQPVTNYPL